jgi:hypothetical protein
LGTIAAVGRQTTIAGIAGGAYLKSVPATCHCVTGSTRESCLSAPIEEEAYVILIA